MSAALANDLSWMTKVFEQAEEYLAKMPEWELELFRNNLPHYERPAPVQRTTETPNSTLTTDRPSVPERLRK